MSDVCLIIAARSSSTRVPGKNVHVVSDKRVIEYTFEQLIKVEYPVDTVVMTDSGLVAERAMAYDIRVIDEDAEDQRIAAFYGRLEKTVQRMERRGRPYDYVLQIGGDCPVRPANLFDRAIEVLKFPGVDSVQSAEPVPLRFHPNRCGHLDTTGGWHPIMEADASMFTQDFPTAYSLNGAVWGFRRELLPKFPFTGQRHPSQVFRPILCEAGSVLEIDDPEDMERFRQMIERSE